MLSRALFCLETDKTVGAETKESVWCSVSERHACWSIRRFHQQQPLQSCLESLYRACLKIPAAY